VTDAGIPIVVAPLANHWEQANTARYVSKKFSVRSIDAVQVTAEILAAAVQDVLHQPAKHGLPFRGDGHIIAAREIAMVLGK
jgi:glycosyltransferase A (GT-A) superfamily protein (DUF2064 family)